MRWARLAGLVVLPPYVFWWRARRRPGFARQPAIVGAALPDVFRSEVEKAGGPHAVRAGVLLDYGFIVTLTVPSGVVLARSAKPGLVGVAGVAAAVDVAEDLLLLRALSDPTSTLLGVLRTTGRLKNATYLALVGTVAWQGLR